MEERGSPLYQLFLLGLSIYVLTALVLEAFVVSDPEIKRVLQYTDFTICLIFLGDFFVNLYLAKSKLEYMKWGWIDLLASIPMVDPLRWGRLTRIIRVLRMFRAVKSIRLLIQSVQASKMQSLTIVVVLITFFSYTTCASLILEFEGEYDSMINTAEAALWWSFLNVMNSRASIDQTMSAEGAVMTIILNKIGLLLFAYFNALIITWLIQKKSDMKVNKNSLPLE